MRGIRALLRLSFAALGGIALLVWRSDAAQGGQSGNRRWPEAGRPAGIDQAARGGAPVGGRGSTDLPH
jgi:hypothetical protein